MIRLIKKSTPIVSYCELPNDRVLSNSVTDAAPYGGRDTAAVSLRPSWDRIEEKKQTHFSADRCCTQSRANGTNQHMVEEKKTLIKHICLRACQVRQLRNLSPEVTCRRAKRLGEILVSLIHSTAAVSHNIGR